ncbi:hypothetical protein ACG83_10880 [Frankia sp. R43]|uniref:hypothetical protein n=1 Tax=Frankia sp. R43 TaxID=269536 RepID=UPI0006C9EEDA|nr:hypothetical protein [Frankia sp. R43]KPM55769.1 hypothetical protein ACG83_10880 [Frankia sp. R43]
MKTDRSAAFPTLLAAALAAHEVADNLLGQTDNQAGRKDKPGAEGWCANLRHVAAYHAVMAAMVGATVRVTRVPVSGRGLLAGFVVSAASHGFIDRRWPIRRLMAVTGSPAFAEMTITTSVPGMPWKPGLNRGDQAAHAGMLWLAALVATRLSRVRTTRDLW